VNKYLSEFLGTFLMVLLGCGSIAIGWNSLMVSITFGFAVFMAIMIFQPHSGAHINPAVSIAFAAKGDLDAKLLPGYIIAQCFGGFLAALIVMDGETRYSVSLSEAFLIEISITLLLMYSIHILVNRKENLPTLALGVGSMVAILAYLFGEYTGAGMNPARSLGPNIVTSTSGLILYVIGPVIGAIISNFIALRDDE